MIAVQSLANHRRAATMTSSIPAAAVVFVIGAAVSLGAAAVLVARLERLGERLGISEALLGLLTALAADAPEISAAVTALAGRQRDVGVGVVLGSNVFNLAALLGLGAVVAGRIALHRKVVIFEGAVALWMALASAAVITRLISPAVGLVAVLAVFLPYAALSAVRPAGRYRLPLPGQWRAWLASAVAEEESELSSGFHLGKGGRKDLGHACLALAVVAGASAGVEHAASTLGVRYAVPGIVVGGIVLAAVTSLPNAVAAVYLARRGRGAATLSEALNSNTLNVVAGLFVPAVVTGLGRPSGSALLVAACYAGLTACTLALAFAGRGLGRRAGALIIVLYLLFAWALVAA
jgi:cation:H+ antiporter